MSYQLMAGTDPEAAREGFSALTAELYRGHPLKASQKERWDGPHFVQWFLLKHEGVPAAKAVLYYNKGLNGPASPTYLVGNYDATDGESAKRLLAAVKAEAAHRGARCLVGPMNGSTWDDYRFGLEAAPPFFTEPIHLPSYPAQFLEAGFSPLTDYVSHRDHDLVIDEPYMAALQRRFDGAGVRVRPIDLSRFEHELVRLHRFCQLSFQNAVLFSPIAEQDFLDKYLPLAPILKPEFVLLAEHHSRLVGLVLCLDDLYNKQSKGVIFKTVARDPGRAYAGIVHLMGNAVHKTARRAGYDYSIHAFMHQDNVSRTVSKRFVGQPYKRYQLYVCRIDA